MRVVKTWPSVVLPKPKKKMRYFIQILVGQLWGGNLKNGYQEDWIYMSSPVFDTLEEAEQYVEDHRQKVLLRDGRVRSIRIVEGLQ